MLKTIALVCLGASTLITFANAQTSRRAELKVKVLLQNTKKEANPFRNVSGFSLKRINQPYQGARCYEPTDQHGQLYCQFMCLSQGESATINLVPPRALDGYADSGEIQVELRGCVLSKKEVVVVYRDAAVALMETLQGTPLQSQFAGLDKSGSWTPPKFEAIKSDFAGLAATDAGRAKLSEVRLFTDVLSKSSQYQKSAEVAAALQAVSIGSSNILLGKAAEQYLEPGATTRISISGSKTDYYANLDFLEAKIQRKPGKTAKDFEALRGIRELKEEPAQYQFRESPFLAGRMK